MPELGGTNPSFTSNTSSIGEAVYVKYIRQNERNDDDEI